MPGRGRRSGLRQLNSGGGSSGSGENITINGGEVTASGGDNWDDCGAGIGGVLERCSLWIPRWEHRVIQSALLLLQLLWKSVTVSREPSGKYFASLLFDCENQTAEKRQAEKFLGMDFAMHGMCVFSTGERAGYPMFYRNAEKKLAREQRKLSRCEKGSRNYQKQKKKVALSHEKIKNQRKDF